jgi:hypothetical protein
VAAAEDEELISSVNTVKEEERSNVWLKIISSQKVKECLFKFVSGLIICEK